MGIWYSGFGWGFALTAMARLILPYVAALASVVALAFVLPRGRGVAAMNDGSS